MTVWSPVKPGRPPTREAGTPAIPRPRRAARLRRRVHAPPAPELRERSRTLSRRARAGTVSVQALARLRQLRPGRRCASLARASGDAERPSHVAAVTLRGPARRPRRRDREPRRIGRGRPPESPDRRPRRTGHATSAEPCRRRWAGPVATQPARSPVKSRRRCLCCNYSRCWSPRRDLRQENRADVSFRYSAGASSGG